MEGPHLWVLPLVVPPTCGPCPPPTGCSAGHSAIWSICILDFCYIGCQSFFCVIQVDYINPLLNSDLSWEVDPGEGPEDISTPGHYSVHWSVLLRTWSFSEDKVPPPHATPCPTPLPPGGNTSQWLFHMEMPSALARLSS